MSPRLKLKGLMIFSGFAPQSGASVGVEMHAGGQGRQLPRGQRRPDRSPVPGRDREKDGEVPGWIGPIDILVNLDSDITYMGLII